MILARPAETVRRLDGLDQPTLLLQGAQDVLTPLSAARRMADSHPDWRFEVASGVGHVPMLEAPAWTTAVIEDWLGREGAPAASAASAASAPVVPVE
jgi:pimeloyl-ACP methyl ester carboxylesterase